MLELAVLGLLAEEDLHGYELKRRIEGLAATASFGSLYPALNRLARAGHVASSAAPTRRSRPRVPMTGSLDGEAAVFATRAASRSGPTGRKARKVYRLTESGRVRLGELLTDGQVDDRVFALKLALARLLDPADRRRLIDRRLGALGDRAVELRRTRLDATDPWVRTVLDQQLAQVDLETGWLTSIDVEHPDPDSPQQQRTTS